MVEEIRSIENELAELEAKRAELERLMAEKREEAKRDALTEIRAMMVDAGITAEEMIAALGGTSAKSARTRTRKPAADRDESRRVWIEPVTGTTYVKGVIPNAIKKRMADIGWGGTFAEFRAAHMQLAS